MVELSAIDYWVMFVGMLCAMSCGLLGNFMLLRKMSMMGDAISHAVLPGIAGAFLFVIYLQSFEHSPWLPEGVGEWVGSLNARSPVPMLFGAGCSGLLTTMFTQWVQRFGKVDQGAAMGVVFTTLFAIGLIMIRQAADHVDLDPSCVLYGQIDLVGVSEFVEFGGISMPRSVQTLLVVLGINVVCVGLFYKELKITAFDPALADTLGISSGKMHYLLMILVAITTVASFEVIGSILVIAMLIVPAATAHLLTDRLPRMIMVSLVVGIFSAVLGHLMAINLPVLLASQVGGVFIRVDGTSTAGMMAVASGMIFGVTVFLAPRHGLVMKWWHQVSLGQKILREDILGMLYRLEENSGKALCADHFVKAMHEKKRRIGGALGRMIKDEQIELAADGYHLTDDGKSAAKKLVRSHRLWEAFLIQHMALPESHLHGTAERLEHITTEAMAKTLAASTGNPTVDPHGREIPGEDVEE